jgi:membrane fusion protein (multidrug efflux system)
MRRGILAVIASVCMVVAAAAQPAPEPSVSVGVVTAAKQPVAKAAEFTGRVEAVQRVDVQARVSGYLDAVLFTEGAMVREGDKLLQIDPAPFEASLLQARGALLQAQGVYRNAVLQRERADELVRTSATSVATRDQRVADEQNAQGSVVRADADLKTAQINLGYATITAPIEGRVGRALVTKGNLVGPSTGNLTLIVSQDPMFVMFPVSQREFLDIRQSGNAATRDTVAVKLRFADGSDYNQTGRIDFVDVTVDRSTDTVLVRAKVPNPDRLLVADQFVRISVVGNTPEEKVVIPQAALIADQEGIYVFVVQGGKAVVKRVKLGPEVGAGVAVESGLAEGDTVIVNGTQALRPGTAVLATPVPASQQVKG